MRIFTTADEIYEACAQAVPESLTLEFKRKEDASSALLSKTDRRNISKSVAAFANGEGGILVFGIATTVREGLDAASEAVPISNLQSFRNQFEGVCNENISPPIAGLSVEVLPLNSNENLGFLVCRIPRSLNRPHMSTAAGENRFYRRSFTGNLLMTPGEIRDQILAVREAILDPVVQAAEGGTFNNHGNWISGRVPIVFRLKNVGRALCRNPFLRVQASCTLHSYSASYDGPLSAWKTEYIDGYFIHVEDQIHCFELSFNAYVRLDILAQKFEQNLANLTEAVIVLPGSADLQASTITDKISLEAIDLTLRFGAENAAATEQEMTFTRETLAKKILTQSTIRNTALQTIGFFRADLVEAFAKADPRPAAPGTDSLSPAVAQ